MQDKENLIREHNRLLADNKYLQGRNGHPDSSTHEDGSAKANSKTVSKSMECRVDLKSVRLTDENLNPDRKKPHDDR